MIIPNLNIFKVPNRRVLLLQGNQVFDFLQGLITNNIKTFVESGDHLSKSLFTGFLNSKGRVLFDSLIHVPSEKSGAYVEYDSRVESEFIGWISRYLLRSDVSISVQSNLNVLSSLQAIPGYTSLIDGRCDGLVGFRTLVDSSFNHSTDYDDGSSYQNRIIKLGIPEGIDAISPGAPIPQEFNFDYMNGIDYRKGCYVGQELTIRTHHTGQVRKRIVPFEADTLNLLPESHSLVFADPNDSKSRCGKIIQCKHNIGLSLLKLDVLSHQKLFLSNGTCIKVRVPEWLSNKIL